MNDDRFYLTAATKRRLRSLVLSLVSVAVIVVGGAYVIRREQAPAVPATPAEVAWAGRAQPLLLAVDRVVNRHDALAAASAGGRPAARPTAAMLFLIRSTLRRFRKLPPAPLRLRAFRAEPIDALEDAQKAYVDYAAGSRSGDERRLARADLEWDTALVGLAHLDQLVAEVTLPSSIKPAKAAATFVAFEAALWAQGARVQAARTIERALQHDRGNHRLAGKSAAAFTSLSLQAATLPATDKEISAIGLTYQSALHHAVLGSQELAAGQSRAGVRAFTVGDTTYRLFLRRLSAYGTTLTAGAAARR
jgi:hypothetical protein